MCTSFETIQHCSHCSLGHLFFKISNSAAFSCPKFEQTNSQVYYRVTGMAQTKAAYSMGRSFSQQTVIGTNVKLFLYYGKGERRLPLEKGFPGFVYVQIVQIVLLSCWQELRSVLIMSGFSFQRVLVVFELGHFTFQPLAALLKVTYLEWSG